MITTKEELAQMNAIRLAHTRYNVPTVLDCNRVTVAAMINEEPNRDIEWLVSKIDIAPELLENNASQKTR